MCELRRGLLRQERVRRVKDTKMLKGLEMNVGKRRERQRKGKETG
jgi:hypothetical protein